ncbi:MFS transporter [Streptomyces sp. NPDC047928]|uniref:MFS transporter n=1 Tax=unclassified Streptomyces TaxID=2593676 RepID=UPI00371B0960
MTLESSGPGPVSPPADPFKGPPADPPAQSRARRPARPWTAAAVVCLGLYLLGLDLTILNVAAPDLQRELRAATAEVQWVIDGYALVLGGTVLATGAVTDRIGRRRAFVAGLVLCAAASVVGAVASSVAQIIGARFAMGAGAALLMPATLSIISNLFARPEERRKGIALWAAVGALGGATGPLVGGFLVEHFSWRAGFWVNLPLAALAVALAFRFVPATRAGHREPVDVTGMVLSALGLLCLVWAIIEGPARGWLSTPVTTAFVLAAVLLTAFVRQQARCGAPMLPLPLLRRPEIGVAALVLALLSLALFGAFFLVSLHLQKVLGHSPWEAGCRTLPLPLALAVGAAVEVPLIARFGVRLPVVLGLGTVSLAFVVLAGASADSGYGRIALFEVVAGFGAGLTAAAGTESVMASVPRERAGLGSAVNDATRQVGSALGVAVQGSVLSAVYSARMPELLAGTPAERLASTDSAHDVVAGQAAPGGAPAAVRAAFGDAARTAFVDGMVTAAQGAGVLTAAAALAAAVWLPAARATAPLAAAKDGGSPAG